MADPVHVERTSKPIKALKLVGVSLLAGSAMAAVKYHGTETAKVALAGAALGALAWAVGRFLGWWKYG